MPRHRDVDTLAWFFMGIIRRMDRIAIVLQWQLSSPPGGMAFQP